MKKIAVMQPYFLPYIGYFQLIYSSDVFVFYDDVNYIKGGWVNRNNFLIAGEKRMLTIPLIKASANRKINEIEIDKSQLKHQKFQKTITQNYSKAPFFKEVYPLFEKILNFKGTTIAQFSSNSIKFVCEFLELDKDFKVSSIEFENTRGLGRVERLIQICKEEKADIYINPEGGKDLYEKNNFRNKGIDLYFLDLKIDRYDQFRNNFVPGLSIIDVLMFNSKERINEMLSSYTLV